MTKRMQHHDIVPAPKKHTVTTATVVRRVATHTPKELVLTILLAAATILVLAGTSAFVSYETLGSSSKEKEQVKTLASREVLTSEVIGEGEDAVVLYSYKGEVVPEKLTEREVVELRTASSFTEDLGKDENGKGIYGAVFFPRTTFYREGETWRYVEYDSAPKKLFDAVRDTIGFLPRLAHIAHAATDTVYAGVGDGQIAQTLALTWSDAYSATTGFSAYTDTSYSTNAAVASGKVAGASISRIFLPFVTSTIPSSATITAATLNLYATSSPSFPGDAYDYVTVVQTSQATHTALADADYDNVGTTEGIASGDRKEISTISSGSYVSFPLNATGITWIAKSGVASNCSATAGITCLGLRDGHDITNNAPATDANASQAFFSSSEATGTSQDPYLSVTYSAGFAFWQFDLF